MASSLGGDVPAEIRAAAAANDLLVEAREGAATLRAFLLQLDDHRAPWAQGVVDGVLDRLSSAMSALDVVSGAVAGGVRSPAAGAGSWSDGAARPQQSVSSSGNTRKRSFVSRSRSQRPSEKKITATLEDGHVWRKYGQKEIQNSSHPRSYYRCTHKSDQGCNAKRQVQVCEADLSKFVVTYYGEHTCRDPSTIPLVVPAGAGEAPERANNLISFGTSLTINNAAASTGAAASSSQYLVMGGSTTADQLSTSWCAACASDDVFSSSAGSFMHVDDELIGAVVGSAGVTSTATAGSSALDRGGHGGMGMVGGGGGTASFPPSPNGLGSFVVGSLGSIGGDDDDLFPMD